MLYDGWDRAYISTSDGALGAPLSASGVKWDADGAGR
jgi:hypothetical protein